MKKAVVMILAMVATCAMAQENIKASQAAFIAGVTEDEASANAYGVYPVEISWDNNKDVDYYTVVRYDEGEKVWKLCDSVKATSENTNNLGRVTFIDHNSTALPNVEYKYQVSGINRVKGTVRTSEVVTGYGALTALCYIDTYNLTVLASHKKLTLMHKRFALQKLGKERIAGDMCGGVFYHARVRGFGGLATVRYDDYEELPGWLLSGNTNVKANIFANGKMLDRVNCRGMYPGFVDYSNVKIKKGKANGGFYTVSREGFPNRTIVWDAIQTEKDHVYQECESDEKSAPSFAGPTGGSNQLASVDDDDDE